MAEPPFFDGRTPLTKEAMNDLIEAARRAKMMTASAPLEVHDLGAMGQHVRLGTPPGVASTGEGFWGRVDVNSTTNVATWYEGVPGIDPLSNEITLIQKPGGRTGPLDQGIRFLQGLGNLRPLQSPYIWTLRFAAPATSGTFTLRYRIGAAGAPVTLAATPFSTTPAALATLLNAANPGAWVASGTASRIYYVGLNESAGDPSASLLEIVSQTTNQTLSISLGTAFQAPQGGGMPLAEMYNFLPGGQAIWIRPVTDQAGATRYLFSLPYCGLYVRIIQDDPDLAGRYFFKEQMTLGDGASFMDHPAGLSGLASEINGETLVPEDTVVWAIPLFRPTIGWSWVFQAVSDWRMLTMPADATGYPAGANCVLVYARTIDIKSNGAFGTAFATLVDDTGTLVTMAGLHLGLRIGFSAAGWPKYLRVSGMTVGWSGTLPPVAVGDGTFYTLEIESGAVTGAVVS